MAIQAQPWLDYVPMAVKQPPSSFDPALRARLDPMGKATDEQLQALLAQYPTRTNYDVNGKQYEQTTFQIQPNGTVAVGVWAPSVGRFSPANIIPSIDVALGTQQATPEMNTLATGYGQLVNPYGNAYMQRLQEQLAGRSEANLQKMNALMSQRGMGGTGLAAARALQAQSDVGQQLLGAQQEATQLGAQFDLSRLAGLTGQQQFGRQQTEAERSGMAARTVARKAETRAERGAVAELVSKAATPYAMQGQSALGIKPTSTGGGTPVQQGTSVQGFNAGSSAPVSTNLEQFNKDLYYTPYVAGSRNYRIM